MARPLAERVIKGSAWLFGSWTLSKLGRAAMMLVLAALLSPRDYGIIAVAAVIVSALQLTNEAVWPAVVHRRNLNERFLDTAFTVNILIGVGTALGLALTAPWIAYFYSDPEITNLLRVMALGLIAEGIFYVPDGLLRKDLSFKSRALPELAGAFGGGAVTIVLVLLGAGVLGFAIGFVVDVGTRCALTVRQVDRRPKLAISWHYLKEIVAYSKHIMGSNLAMHFSSNIDFLIVGRVLGAGTLGLYTLAFNLANYPVTNLAHVLSRIAFPTFAALQEDLDYARQTYLKMIQIVTALVLPLMVMLTLLSPSLIPLLLGEKWRPAILPLQVMAVAGTFRVVSVLSSDMLRALGSPEVPFKIFLVEGLLVSGTLLLVATSGIEAVALAMTVILSLTACTIIWITCRRLGIRFWKLGQALVPGITFAGSGALPILSYRLLGSNLLPGGLEPLVLIAASGAAISISLATVCKGLVKEVIALAKSSKQR